MFLDRFPAIDLEMSLTDRFADVVAEDRDVAIRIGRSLDSSLVARRLAAIRRVVVASPDYLARHGLPATPQDLIHHDCLSHRSAGLTEWRFVGSDGQVSVVETHPRVSANNGDTLRILALMGQGIAYLPTFFVCDDLRDHRLVTLFDGCNPDDLALNALYPAARYLAPKVRVFIDYLADCFAPIPYWDAGLV